MRHPLLWLAPALLLAACASSPRSDEGVPCGATDGRSAGTTAEAPLSELHDRAGYAMLDAGITYRARADVDASLEEQARDLTARVDGARGQADPESEAELLLERAGVHLALAHEHAGSDRQFFSARALQDAEEAVFLFGEDRPGSLAGFFLLAQVYELNGDPEQARDFYRAVIERLAEADD